MKKFHISINAQMKNVVCIVDLCLNAIAFIHSENLTNNTIVMALEIFSFGLILNIKADSCHGLLRLSFHLLL